MAMLNAMTANPLLKVRNFGQSIWIDYIHRAALTSGEFERYVRDDGVCGVTSNPAIFEDAIAHSDVYASSIKRLADKGLDAPAIYETLAIEDIRMAADILRETYDRSGARDGYVSLEVSPHLAHDTKATVAEARRLWKLLARPNVMIKIPGTAAGLPAITQAIADGINVNVTLLFSVARYQDVAFAYLAGIEQRLVRSLPVHHVASVASFFLSRIDAAVDKQLDTKKIPEARIFRGEAAVACARLAYQEYVKLLQMPRWHTLVECGANPQRLLWASTSSKDPAYRDTKYVDALIGADTVNTVPLKTLDAYRDHGNPAPRLEQELEQAQTLPGMLRTFGINMEQVAEELEREGIRKFVEPFDRLLDTLRRRTADMSI
jgi:transaldolase